MSQKINAATIAFLYKSYMSCSDINDERFASQNVTPLRVKSSYCSQTNANFALKNICDEPKISHLLTLFELEYRRKVWICMSQKINTATIAFWYISYMSCSDINDKRFTCQNVTPLRKKMIG